MHFISINLVLSCICLALCLITLIASNLVIHNLKRKFFYDEISGLFTFSKFKKESEKILKSAKKDEYSFVCIDIDNFQYLADSLGRDIANSLLALLGKNFRKAAPKDALLCRRYADNFVMLIHETFEPIIEDYVVNMVSIVSKMGNLLPLHYTLSFTTGVYVVGNPDDDIELMVHKANVARIEGRKSVTPGRIS
nr:diguanylate cyclase [Treponema sp.]